jgi:hypothetical protein
MASTTDGIGRIIYEINTFGIPRHALSLRTVSLGDWGSRVQISPVRPNYRISSMSCRGRRKLAFFGIRPGGAPGVQRGCPAPAPNNAPAGPRRAVFAPFNRRGTMRLRNGVSFRSASAGVGSRKIACGHRSSRRVICNRTRLSTRAIHQRERAPPGADDRTGHPSRLI